MATPTYEYKVRDQSRRDQDRQARGRLAQRRSPAKLKQMGYAPISVTRPRPA